MSLVIDPFLISKTINFYLSNNFDYVSNSYPPSFADGLDIEVFSKESLELIDYFYGISFHDV